MTAQSEPEIKGNFLTHPFAELLAEIAAAALNGSLRVENKERKCVVYFKSGRAVFAVSNDRSSRLFEMLLKRNKLDKAGLVRIPNFQNDFELTTYLKEKQLLTDSDCNKLFAEQIENILVDVLTWESGEWTFNYLARARDGLEFNVDVARLLVEFGRCMPAEKVLGRFRSFDETFSRAPLPETSFNLSPDEAFVLSRTVSGPLTASDLLSVAGISESAALHAIYTLWLGGLLTRGDWQPAFSAERVESMRSARLEIKREAKMPGVTDVLVESSPGSEPQEVGDAASDAKPDKQREPEIELEIEEYLKRVETAETYYDILGVELEADIDELKRSYFALARKFHPDRYHAEGGEMLSRVQHAFSELAQAHETLKHTESREAYDYKMRKELAVRETARKAAEEGSGEASMQFAQASESFEHGFTLLMDGAHEAALPFLARAAHWDPTNARYHAYYGMALSSDGQQRHKAEAEMQAALKIDPNNPTFRLLLAEFFIQHNLPKRAEGELNRLLALHPDNREALKLLGSLKVNN